MPARILPRPARERAWGFLATLVGGLLLFRGADDGEVADEILRACRRAVTSSRRPEPG